jgi:hypothetical protein
MSAAPRRALGTRADPPTGAYSRSLVAMLRPPTLRVRVLVVLAVAVALGVGALGCGDDEAEQGVQPIQPLPTVAEPAAPPGLDKAALESRLEEALSVLSATPVVGAPQIQSHGVVEVRSVDCPSEPSQGETMTCKVDAINRSGLGKDFKLSGTVNVTQTDAEGRTFRYRAKLRAMGQTTTLSGTIQPTPPIPTPVPPPESSP